MTRMANVSSGLRSTFAWERIDGVMVVTDLEDGMLQAYPCSVTNDAENVIRYLYRVAQLQEFEPVVYCDTQGRWDAMLHQDGKFVNFDLIGAHAKETAMRIVKEKK